MKNLQRTLNLTGFVLTEYLRTGRFILELLASIVFFYLLLWRGSAQADYFFGVINVYIILITFVLSYSMLGYADRTAGYIPLMHGLKRASYLLGHYLAAQIVVYAHYFLICIVFVILRRGVTDLSISDWLLGSLPLLLNVAQLGAFLTLLASIVLSSGWRLFILALLALAFSGQLINSKQLEDFSAVTNFLEVLRTIVSTPLLPAFTGFALSVSRDYGSNSFIIPIAQLSLTLGLLGLALYSFNRRELDFKER